MLHHDADPHGSTGRSPVGKTRNRNYKHDDEDERFVLRGLFGMDGEIVRKTYDVAFSESLELGRIYASVAWDKGLERRFRREDIYRESMEQFNDQKTKLSPTNFMGQIKNKFGDIVR